MKKSSVPGWAILATGLLLVVGLALVVPVMADQQDYASSPARLPQATPVPTIAPPPIPTATPEPAQSDFQEWAGRMCASGQTIIEEVFQDGDRLYFQWYIDDQDGTWMEIPEPYENFYRTFRIERALDDYSAGKDDLGWALVDTVGDEFTWEGTAESGEWIYRIALVEIALGGHRHPCPAPYLWDEVVQHLYLPPTEAEWAEHIPAICAGVEIVDLEGDGYWDDAELYWGITLEDLADSRFYEFGLDFAVEYRPEGGEEWSRDDLIGFSDHWATGYIWNGPALPGKVTYRVAVTGVNGVGMDEETFPFPCEGELRWREIDVVSPTLEERAQMEAEQEILLAEATRCAREAFVKNISPEALPVVEKYVDELIAQWIPQDQGPWANAELASYTIMMCGLGSGQGSGEMGYWALMLLFDGF